MASEKITLAVLQEYRRSGRRFAMLTAYDYPTAATAQAAGGHSLLIGDSLGNVILGQPTTREVPLELMITLGSAVRRGAPRVFFVGDMPFVSMQGGAAAVELAAKRFMQECGCDAVKIETAAGDARLVERIARGGVAVIAHLGLRPQTVTTPDGYRAQARSADEIRQLVNDAQTMVSAGAALLLLEAVPPEAAAAVVGATDVPVIGCGAGPACHGHVVVTHDMLGFGAPRPPRFVPQLAELRAVIGSAMSRYVSDIERGRYPSAEHFYALRQPIDAGTTTT